MTLDFAVDLTSLVRAGMRPLLVTINRGISVKNILG